MRRSDITIVITLATLVLVSAYALACHSVGVDLYGL